MIRSLIATLVMATALLATPSSLCAQSHSQLLAGARAQLIGHNLDSAITLLRAVADNGQADSSERAEAFMWLGVTTFYKGQDSSAKDAFREALRNDPLLVAATMLANLDSTLADMWEREQTIAVCGEMMPAWGWPPGPPTTARGMNQEARAGQAPEIISGPPLLYPSNLREALIQGRVLVRAVIDPSGKAERGSVRVLSTPNHGFNSAVTDYTEHAKFSGAMAGGARIRSCVVLPIDFKITSRANR